MTEPEPLLGEWNPKSFVWGCVLGAVFGGFFAGAAMLLGLGILWWLGYLRLG